MAHSIGIMQGRLSPPVGDVIQAFPAATWKDEFGSAKQIGLSHIEWIFDQKDFLNPLSNHSGLIEIQVLMIESGVKINSLCADYFMSELLLHGSAAEQRERMEKLKWLILQCSRVKIHHLVLPFVDQSQIETNLEQEQLTVLMKSLLPTLAQHHIELHLETSLPPSRFASLLERIDSPLVKINYDMGNSVSFGYDPGEEFEAYGNWVGSIHIKDRLKGGPTVPLGHGEVDFCRLFRLLEKMDYQGDFVLQIARDKAGDEISWAKHNLEFVHDLLSRTP